MPLTIRREFVVISSDTDPSIKGSWVAKVVDRDGVQFVAPCRSDHKCVKLLSNEFGMVSELKRLRNEKITKIMQDLEREGDDMADAEEDAECGGPRLKRPRKQLVDDISEIIEVDVQDVYEHWHIVKVLRAADERALLYLELTDDNMNLLKTGPMPRDQQVFRPNIDDENIQWVSSRNSLRLGYFDLHSQKWKQKSMKIKYSSDYSEMQDLVDKTVRVLQTFYEQHHGILADAGADDAGEDQEAENGAD